MKRIILAISALCGIVLCASDPIAAPVKPMKSFGFTPDMAEVKAGEKVKTVIKVAANEGFVVEGCNVAILRKDAPKEFFAIPKLKINKHKHPNYDSFSVKPYTRLKAPAQTAEIPLEINTAGFKEGDYAVLAVCCFLDKNKKRHYAGGNFFLTVTTSDNSVVPGGAAVAPARITLTPGKLELAAGSKLPEIKVDYLLDESEKVRLYTFFISRNRAPESFFAANAAKVKKHESNAQYDRIELLPNRAPAARSNQGTAVLPNGGLTLTPGKYLFVLQLYGIKPDGKSFYRAQSLPVTVK